MPNPKYLIVKWAACFLLGSLSVGCSGETAAPSSASSDGIVLVEKTAEIASLDATGGAGSESVETPAQAPEDESAAITVEAVEEAAQRQHTLSYLVEGRGAIVGEAHQQVSRGGAGSAVQAVPAEHHHFVRWSDGTTANPRTDQDVTGDLSVSALFAVDQYDVTYAPAENGSIEGATRQRVDYGGSGSVVRAVPAVGHHFAGWSDGSAENPRRERDVRGEVAVTALFRINEYTLDYAADEEGWIEGDSRQRIFHGENGGNVTAVPRRGYHFVRWSDGMTSAERIDAEVTGDLSVRAEFAVNTYRVGGTVSGLVAGSMFVLRNNGADDLAVTSEGDFAFETTLFDGSPYGVSVSVHPSSPNQTCTVRWGDGLIDAADIDDVVVDCVLHTYAVGGTVYGLPEGGELVLRNNGGDDLVVTAAGDFTFARALEDGSVYEVAIARQHLKPNWLCTMEHAAGILAGYDVTDVDIACFPELVLQAVPGRRRIDLNWNGGDFPGGTFHLCAATKEISAEGFATCRQSGGGWVTADVAAPHTVADLVNDTPYWFQMEVVTTSGRRTVSKAVMAIPFGGLNDTGIDWCADQGGNRHMGGTRTEKAQGCETLAAGFPRQDAHRGRDAQARSRSLPKTGSGSAGFDFTRICESGEAAGEGRCPPNPTLGSAANNWACTRDNVTGLLWEVKLPEGLRGRENTYTWYVPQAAVHGGAPGTPNGGVCSDSGCDTDAYVRAVNALGLCGVSDWRVPTRKELLSIVDNSRFEPSIDPAFFPNTEPGHYWSSTPYADQAGSAWHVYFHYGEVYPGSKSQGQHLRLVRGRTATFGMNNP